MISRGVLPSDGLQAALKLHGFRLGGRFQVVGSRTIYDVGTLRSQLPDMLLDILRHHLAFWNDEGLVSCASCRLQHPVFIVCGEQQAVGDIITVESRTIDGENTLDKLRGKTAHRVDTKLHQ